MKCARLIYILTTAVFITACSNTKYLHENQFLYIGADIKIKSTEKISNSKKKELKTELEGLVRPKPNSKILGIRFKLWVYNIAGTPKGKGIRNWFKNKIGEPPVLYSEFTAEKNRNIFQNKLENRGYFQDTVMLDTVLRNKKIATVYTAEIGAQYKISGISFPSDSSSLSKQLQEISKLSLLQPDRAYDLDVIKQERERINRNLKEHGYFYFNPDYILIDVDSTAGDHHVNMDVHLKDQTPSRAKDVYRINDVTVYADYDIHSDSGLANSKVEKFEGYTIIDPLKKFRPKIFSRTLVFKPGDIYNRTDHNLSLNRLITLGVYKFVKARFEPVDTIKGNYLNAFYYLSPTQKKSIHFEVSALTKSNNANGGELSLSWRNRNLLKGAELFIVSVYGGLEKQVQGESKINIRRAGTDINFFVPRIIAPFNFKSNSAFVPKTRLNTGYELYSRTDQYTLNSVKFSAGYLWRENVRKEHQLDIININFVRPSNISDSFQMQLDTNITLARSIEKQFIIGSTYNFSFHTQIQPNQQKNNFYFNGNLDLSGNLIGLLSGADIDKGKVVEFFDVPVSQYIRAEADFRHYLRFGKYSLLASRMITGIGYAYGNSSTMPFVKAFFAGGTSDLRAFASRSLGPGSYYGGNPRVNGYLPEQPGDIKLELNTEYRMKLFSVVRGALFIDAGNIWTLKEDSLRPGSKFTSTFLNQLAVGVGTGFRLDFDLFVFRLDLSFPLRKPYVTSDSKWVFNQIDFGSSEWRKQNLVFNLAFGYPF